MQQLALPANTATTAAVKGPYLFAALAVAAIIDFLKENWNKDNNVFIFS